MRPKDVITAIGLKRIPGTASGQDYSVPTFTVINPLDEESRICVSAYADELVAAATQQLQDEVTQQESGQNAGQNGFVEVDANDDKLPF